MIAKHVVVTAGCVGFLTAVAMTQAPERLTPVQARERVGQVATVCGTVTSYRCQIGRGTALDLDGPSGTPFSIAIAEADRGRRFAEGFESRQDGAVVCATGRVERDGARYMVRIADPDALQVQRPAATPGPVTFTPCDGGVVTPKVIRDVKPQYTSEAMQKEVRGTVTVQATIGVDGTVRDARITEPLDPSLDKSALDAVRQWQFTPGTRNGQPSPIAVAIELTFTLK